MANPKRAQKVAPQNKNNTPNSPEADLSTEDGWVIVKKQRVRILIPSLPVRKPSTASDQQPSQPQTRSGKAINTESPNAKETHQQLHSVEESDKSMPLILKRSSPVTGMPGTIAKVVKLQRQDIRVRSEIPDQAGKIRYKNELCLYSRSKISKRPINFLSAVAVLNKKMRASNLERKLQKAGGLSSWLASLGLDQFVKIFQGKGISKFQLVNLTMKKLKDMGADAVGPRRKLMHAIDCLCQPHCFEALQSSRNQE